VLEVLLRAVNILHGSNGLKSLPGHSGHEVGTLPLDHGGRLFSVSSAQCRSQKSGEEANVLMNSGFVVK
jgi:hypothetical protein